VVEAGIRFIQSIMLVVCGYLVYLTGAPLVRAMEQPSVAALDPVATTAETAAYALPRYRIIGERNLFATPTSAVLVPVEQVFEESKLDVTLLGTLASQPAELSVALLQIGMERQLVRIGERIQGARVERIDRRQVIVENRGKLESIKMLEPEPLSGPGGPRDLRKSRVFTNLIQPSTPPVEGLQAGFADGNSFPGPPMQVPPPVATPSIVRQGLAFTATAQSAKERGSSFAAVVGLEGVVLASPIEGLDALLGPAIQKLRARDLVKTGDRVVAINGVPLDDPARLPRILEALAKPGTGSLTIVAQSNEPREVQVEFP
jgi:type II secretory pathway component PulC